MRWDEAKRWPVQRCDGLEQYRVSIGDIVLAMDRTWVNAGLKSAVIRAADIPSLLVQRVARIRAKETAVTAFIAQVLHSHRFVQHVKGTQTETAVPHISAQQIKDFKFFAPPLSEQKKISVILGTWDVALEKLDALIVAKDRHKQGLMQQLLAVAAQKVGHGHARHRLGVLVERVTRKNTVGNDNVLTISAQQGLINQREYFNRSVAGADLSGYYLLQRGEFAYNRSSSIGFPYGALKRLDCYDAGIVSTLYLCFRIKDRSEVSSDYLAHYMDGGFLNAGLRSIAKEGARAHGLLNVTADEFFDLDVFIPPTGATPTRPRFASRSASGRSLSAATISKRCSA